MAECGVQAEADAARVIETLSRTKMRGKRIYVEVARPRREFAELYLGNYDEYLHSKGVE